MNLFKTYTLTWWETALLKAGLLAIGIAIGSYWNLFFSGHLVALIVIAVVTLIYPTYVWAKQ